MSVRLKREQLGSKFGTWLLERQLTPRYGYMGTTKEGELVTIVRTIAFVHFDVPGCGGLWEQIPHQGLDPQCTYSCAFKFDVLPNHVRLQLSY